jgi:hypothetical protein
MVIVYNSANLMPHEAVIQAVVERTVGAKGRANGYATVGRK